jgi:hypothetical protein
LIENYKHVVVDLTLAGSEVMSFYDENSARDLEVVEVEMVDIVVVEAYHKCPDSVNQSFLVVDLMEGHLLVAYFLDYTVRFQPVLVGVPSARSVDNNLAKIKYIKNINTNFYMDLPRTFRVLFLLLEACRAYQLAELSGLV